MASSHLNEIFSGNRVQPISDDRGKLFRNSWPSKTFILGNNVNQPENEFAQI